MTVHRTDGRRPLAGHKYSVCPNMKLTTLDSAIASLREGLNEVVVADDVREKALRAVTRMVE